MSEMIDFKFFTVDGDVLLRPHDKNYFELANDVIIRCYTAKAGTITFKIKAGLLTDLGSIPRWAQSLSGIHSRGNMNMTIAFILHDSLYQSQGHLHNHSKEFVDHILKSMMDKLDVGIGSFKQMLITLALDTSFSDIGWEEFDYADMNTINKKLLNCKWGV